MSIAEKYYRKFYKVKDEIKLSNDQWKVVNMMHECLREYNKPKLPRGAIMINKNSLIQHLKNVNICLNATDKLMINPKYKDFSNGDGGSAMGKIWTALNNEMQTLAHFQLNMPLERINEKITEL